MKKAIEVFSLVTPFSAPSSLGDIWDLGPLRTIPGLDFFGSVSGGCATFEIISISEKEAIAAITSRFSIEKYRFVEPPLTGKGSWTPTTEWEKL